MTNFRNKAKIPSSIGDRELTDSFKHFPDNYSLHYVTNDRDDILAGAILVKITNTILYYFSPATNPAYSKISPMVFLLDSLYGFAKENGCQALDLGISSIGNRPQKGLIRFKDHIGGITSSRFTLQLDL
jgi:lipid II:glycine glycyltransferase (peptidoglycan interpeptide bridge formation enzyme)